MNAPLDPIKLADRRAKRKPAQHAPIWLKGAITDDRDRPVANLANAMLALRRAPEVNRAFGYDAMLCAPILLSTLPACDDGESEIVEQPRPVRDTDVTQVQEWL